jgi:hypothetical protein
LVEKEISKIETWPASVDRNAAGVNVWSEVFRTTTTPAWLETGNRASASGGVDDSDTGRYWL